MAKTAVISLCVTVCVVLLAFAGYWGYKHFSTTPSGHPDDSVNSSQLVDSSTEAAAKPQALDQAPPRKKYKAWESIQLHSNIDLSNWPRIPKHAAFVSFDGRFNNWLLQTPLEIYIPQIDTTYDAIVDQITPNGRHSTTVRASPLAEDSGLQRMILTYGGNQTMAYISTDQGSWELTGDSYLGWLVSTTALKKDRNYAETDVLNPAYDRYADAEYVPRRRTR